ncbi:MAG: acyltransferase [Bacteroides thetaiotaomicron]|nr:acyltransferase [Bacteroides thetaiotaomicron]
MWAGGGVAGAANVSTFNFIFSGGIAVACKCAVNCFYMISGFFIGEKESLERSKKRVTKVWVPTLIYSVCIPLTLMLSGNLSLSAKEIVLLFLPIMGNQYWFTTCFIAVTLLLPYLAKALNESDNKAFAYLVGILLFFDSIQIILGVNAFSNIGYGILHAVTMYVIGYAIRRFDIRIKPVLCILIFICCVGIIGGVTILSIKLTGDRNRTIADYNSIIMIIQSVALFVFFLQIKVRTFRFSRVAPYVFGVYLLNDNQYARDFLWQNIFHCSDFYDNKLLPFHFMIVTIGFVVVGMMIEYFRINSWQILKKRLKMNTEG